MESPKRTLILGGRGRLPEEALSNRDLKNTQLFTREGGTRGMEHTRGGGAG